VHVHGIVLRREVALHLLVVIRVVIQLENAVAARHAKVELRGIAFTLVTTPVLGCCEVRVDTHHGLIVLPAQDGRFAIPALELELLRELDWLSVDANDVLGNFVELL